MLEIQMIVSDAALKDSSARNFPVSKNRSKRIEKKTRAAARRHLEEDSNDLAMRRQVDCPSKFGCADSRSHKLGKKRRLRESSFQNDFRLSLERKPRNVE